MIKKLRCVLVFLLILLGFIGCISEVDQEFQNLEKKLVVNGFISMNDSLFIQVSHTANPLDIRIKPLKNAIVNLTFNDETFTLKYNNQGYFLLTDFNYQPNTEYRIEVKDTINNLVVHSEDISPAIPDMHFENFNATFGVGDEGRDLAAADVIVNDDPNADNYYGIRIIRSFNSVFGSSKYAPDSKDPVVINEGLDAYYSHILLFSDVLIDKRNYPLKIEFEYDQKQFDNHLVLEYFSLSKATFQYLSSYSIHAFNQEPFESDDLINQFESPEPINLYSNIEGGLGIFGAYAVKRDTIF